MLSDSLYFLIEEKIKNNIFILHKIDFEKEPNSWKFFKRSCKDHDYFLEKYILVLSDCKTIIEIIENDDNTESDYSIELDSDDDWRSDLDDYLSDEDEDYKPPI